VRVRADELGGDIAIDDVQGLPEALDERVLDDDPRLSDARVPTGGAGGVLSGQYPNPGFAVPMATQAELESFDDSIRQDLANPDLGAAMVAYRDKNMAEALDGISLELLKMPVVTGPVNAPNINHGYEWNRISSNAAASAVSAGTNQQANYVGWQVYRFDEQGTGQKSTYILSLPFTPELVTGKEIVRVALIRISDGTRFPQVQGAHYSVEVIDQEVTITFATNPPETHMVWVRVIGREQSTNAPLLNFIEAGYDNVSDGAGPMLNMTGAHHTDIGNPGGHLTFLGGSYNEARNGCSYATLMGHDNILDGAAFGDVGGGRNFAKGSGVFARGMTNYIEGDFSFGHGQQHVVRDWPYCGVFGRSAKAWAPGQSIRGNNNSIDTVEGAKQHVEMQLCKSTSDGAEGYLSTISGKSLLVPPGRTTLDLKARILATKNDGSAIAVFDLDVTMSKATMGGAITIAGETAASVVRSTGDTSGWGVRIQAASNGFYIRPTGSAGATIRWIANLNINQISWDAA